MTVAALSAIRSDRVRVNTAFAELDDDVAARAAFDRRNIGAGFNFLAAVIDARFATLRSALRMTREVIND